MRGFEPATRPCRGRVAEGVGGGCPSEWRALRPCGTAGPVVGRVKTRAARGKGWRSGSLSWGPERFQQRAPPPPPQPRQHTVHATRGKEVYCFPSVHAALLHGQTQFHLSPFRRRQSRQSFPHDDEVRFMSASVCLWRPLAVTPTSAARRCAAYGIPRV